MRKFIVTVFLGVILYAAMAFTNRYTRPESIKVEPVFLDEVVTVELPLETEDFGVSLKGHDAFLGALGNYESGNDYTKVNRYGYMGRYQFGRAALKQVKLDVTRKEFLDNPELQELAMKRLLSFNNSVLSRYIEKYDGKTVHGVKVTRSGILAAAHLGGPANVKKWFRSGKDFKDANGTPITRYMKVFKGYSLKIE